MSSSTWPSSSSDFLAENLDDLLAECLLRMEQGRELPRDAIVAQYPAWADELREFFENWDAMEAFSSRLGDAPWAHTGTARTSDFPPRFMEDYELLEEIGRGGMGIIYRARQLSLDRIVAVKMISHLRHDRARFRLEAELAASLEHPNIVSIIEVGEWDSHPYFSMQYVDGKNLSQQVAEEPIRPKQAAEMMVKLADAVHCAHQCGILHRDLKPANVLVDSRGEPHVTDFGLAKQIGTSAPDAEMTVSGTILGTPGYMSPEQADGRATRVTVATDVYGLGTVLYTILTGCPPFESESSVELLRMVVEQPPKPPRSLRSEIPQDLETICLKCLEKTPSSRYHSAEALRDDLQRFLNREPIEARPVGWMGRLLRWSQRNPWVAVSIGVVLLSLVVTTVFFSVMARREYRARLAAESGQQREQMLRKAMNRSMQAEKVARRQAVDTLVDSFTANGLLAHENDDPNLALLWFLEAWNHADPTSPHRRQLAQRILSWQASISRPTAAWYLPQAAWKRLAFDGTGRYLLLQDDEKTLLWDTIQDQQWDLGLGPSKMTIEWHPTEPWLLCGHSDGLLRALSVPSREELWRRTQSDRVTQWSFSRSGRRVAAVHGSSISVWNDCQSIGAAEPQVLAQTANVRHAALDRDGHRLLVACDDDLVRIWTLENEVWSLGAESMPYLNQTHEDGQLIVPPTFFASNHLIVGREAKYKNRWEHVRINFIDLATNRLAGSRTVGASRYFSIAPLGDRFVNLGDHYGRIWDAKNGVHADRLPFRSDVTIARFSPESRWLAAGGTDSQVRIWESSANAFPSQLSNSERDCAFVLPHSHAVVALAWGSERRLATASADGLVRIWELPHDGRLKLLPELDGNGKPYTSARADELAKVTADLLERLPASADRFSMANVNTARLSLDGKRLVLGGRDGTVRIASWPQCDLLSTEIVHPGAIVDALFTLDGEAIISACSDAKLRIWDTATGRMLGFPIPLPWQVTVMDLHEEGRTLRIRRADGRLLEVRLSDWLAGPLTSDASLTWGSLAADIELASGQRIDAGGVKYLTTQEWVSRWRNRR